MGKIEPYQFKIPDSALDDLRNRLSLTRWPERETPSDWTQGVPLAYTQEVAEYWCTQYDWRRCEAQLNALPQFHTEIDGLDIQFMHLQSRHDTALPLVITHGWPGSIIEFLKILGPLTDPTAYGGVAEDAFHVVAPTLPGFGFSGKPKSPGCSVDRIGHVWGELMARLGYENYVAQGGDWGAAVTTSIAMTQTAHCKGIHINMPIVTPSPELMEDLTPFEQEALSSAKYYWDWDSGYSKEQSTRPQTLGYGLVDSPVGQMAWILEKFWAWTDCGGHPENVLSRDELLDNIMMYWLPAVGASSARLYWESFALLLEPKLPVTLPTGASIFPHEIFRASKRWVEERYTNLIYYNTLEKGGHFAAFEQPEQFVAEIRACFRHMR